MTDFMTFSQCLNHLMEKHSLTAASLAALIGVRTGLRRVLANDGTEAMRNVIYSHIVQRNLFTCPERRQLSRALEISRIGVESYKFDRSISNILIDKGPDDIPLMHATSGLPLKQRLEVLKDAYQIEILCVNCCFYSLISALMPLFEDPNRNISMKHLILSTPFSHATAEFLSVMFPLLFDSRYEPLAVKRPVDASVYAVGGNFIAIRYHIAGANRQMFFIPTSEHMAHELPNADEADLFSFYSNILTTQPFRYFPLIEARKRYSDFATLCMTFLNHELNRGTYSLFNDICFQQVPSSICISALHDKGMFSKTEIDELIRRVLPIHEQRYQNQYGKRKPSYHIMTTIGCNEFLKTGCSSDHFFAMRPFTLQERKQIFGEMLQHARTNSNFVPLLIRDPHFVVKYNLVCYDHLGVSVDRADTHYQLENDRHSFFLTFPAFTAQYMDYYLHTLVKTRCYSPEESLSHLEELYEAFLDEHQLH